MLPFFGNRQANANKAVIERLHESVVRAARSPAFYDQGGVPDTFNGRFELLVLHAALVLRRLRAMSPPGPMVAQALVDAVFQHLDPVLRELGVGDMAVPKRMKKLAEGFLGRSVAYDTALGQSDPASLEEALRRNIYAGGTPAPGLARYVRAAVDGIEATPGEELAQGGVAFPDPAGFLTHDHDA